MNGIAYGYARFCRERFPLPTEEQVASLEEHIGVTFPDDYRQFLLNYNGGLFNEPDIVAVTEGCPVDCLTMLFGINVPYSAAELGKAQDLSIFDDNDPPQVVPIGDTIMGGLILLIVQGEVERGCVVLKVPSSGSYFLANGIEDFFELLREPVDE